MDQNLEIRFAKTDDASHIIDWFQEPGVLRWYPLVDMREIKDAVRESMRYVEKKAALTATIDGVPVGFANLYINPYKKLAHQCLFFILVDANFRNRGVGTRLIKAVEKIAKEDFQIEMLHIEVYEENPALSLYERLGYKKYGFQKNFLKEEKRYRGKTFMQKFL